MFLKKFDLSNFGFREIYLGAIFTMFFFAGLLYYGHIKMKETEKAVVWVKHTTEVLHLLTKIETQVFRMVTARRTFYITESEVDLKDFQTTIPELQKLTTELSKKTRDNHDQATNTLLLMREVGDLADYYAKTLQDKNRTVPTGRPFPGEVIVSRILKLIQTMEDHEERLLTERMEASSEVHQKANSLFIFTSFTGIIIILSSLVIIAGELKKRKTVQDELFYTLNLQKAVLDNAPYAILSVNVDGAVTLFNKAAEDLLQYKKEEVIGMNAAVFHLPQEIEHWAKKLSRRFNVHIEPGADALRYRPDRGIIESDVWTYVRKDKSQIPVQLTIVALRNEKQEINGYLGIAFDITERLENEQALLEAKEQALAGTRAKSEFLANMSHEMRTPMNAILGMAEILSETKLSEEQKRYVDIFQNAGKSLLTIINDILDLSKIEAQHFELDHTPFKLSSIIRSASEIISFRARQKDLKLNLFIEPGLQDFYVGDPNRIQQVLLNLLGNAVKFTDKGEVSLSIVSEAKETPGHSQSLVIEVKDTGIGMTSEQLDHLFERFTQGDASITRKYGGTGLGLNITQRLVHLMKGEIKVESVPGKGTTVRISLTLLKDASPAIIDRKHHVKELSYTGTGINEPRRIMVVDDNRENRLVITSFLKSLPWTIDEAADADEAFALFEKNSYDMVLMDMQMPVVDGYTATKKFRDFERNNKRIPTPIVALTAYALKTEILKSLLSGCHGHLTKPIGKKTLIAAIERYTEKTTFMIEPELKSLFPVYLKNRVDELAKFHEAWAESDFETLKSLGHKLKGTAGSYGLGLISSIGDEIEARAMKQDRDSILESLAEYDFRLSQIRRSYET